MSSMQRVLQQQQQRRASHRRATLVAKQQAVESVTELGKGMLLAVNRDVSRVVKNQRELELEATTLAAEVDRFLRQTTRWLHANHELNQALDSLSSIDEWAQEMEDQLDKVTLNLETLTGVEGTL